MAQVFFPGPATLTVSVTSLDGQADSSQSVTLNSGDLQHQFVFTSLAPSNVREIDLNVTSSSGVETCQILQDKT
jgi:hypothetical protein